MQKKLCKECSLGWDPTCRFSELVICILKEVLKNVVKILCEQLCSDFCSSLSLM